MQAHCQEFRLCAMCRALKGNRAGYYAWLQSPMSGRASRLLQQSVATRQARDGEKQPASAGAAVSCTLNARSHDPAPPTIATRRSTARISQHGLVE